MNEEKDTKDTIEEATVVTDEVITPDEVLPPEALQVLKDSRIAPNDATKLRTMFNDMFADAEKYIDMAYKIKVTDISQKPEMKLAGTVRSSIRKVRTTADKKRKEAGEDARLWTGAVNGMFNVLKAMTLPAEAHLEKQEKFAERYEAEQKDQLRKAREIALEPYSEVITSDGMDLSAMTQEGFDNLVNGAKLQIEAKRKEEHNEYLRVLSSERAIQFKNVSIVDDGLFDKVDNALIIKIEDLGIMEVEEFDKFIKGWNDVIDKEIAEKKAEAERIRQKEIDDANARAEKVMIRNEILFPFAKFISTNGDFMDETEEEFQASLIELRKLRDADEKAIEDKRIADEKKAKKLADEEVIADKKAKAEKVKADAEANRLKKVADDAQAETARLKKTADDAKLASDNLKADKLAEEKKLESAPDKDKLLAFAGRLRDANMPSMTTDGGKKVISNISNQFKAMADWIEEAVKKQM